MFDNKQITSEKLIYESKNNLEGWILIVLGASMVEDNNMVVRQGVVNPNG